MEPEELGRRVKDGESETLELKRDIPRPALLAREIASFANTAGGTLVLGVDEHATVSGVNVDRARAAVQQAETFLSPPLELEVESVNADGREVLSISVPRATYLTSAQGAYLGRSGTSTRSLEASEIVRRSSVAPHDEAIKGLAESVESQSKIIEQMSGELEKANSLLRKLGIAAVGAVVGAFAKFLFEVLV